MVAMGLPVPPPHFFAWRRLVAVLPFLLFGGCARGDEAFLVRPAVFGGERREGGEGGEREVGESLCYCFCFFFWYGGR